MKIDARYTDLASFPHLSATGTGRLVRAADGVVIGYVAKRFHGSTVRGGFRGRTVYHYVGIDGAFSVADSIVDLVRKAAAAKARLHAVTPAVAGSLMAAVS
jgi:uncharacterized membrane protein YeaQ/YmgE (transglycosylase-associated protein family)